MLARKLVKLVRKFRWAFQLPGSIPVHWHVGQPNFGDDINPFFFRALMSRPIHFASRRGSHVLGVGSVLNQATGTSMIAGSGLLNNSLAVRVNPDQVFAVRGEYTTDALGFRPPHLGDPGILVSHLFPRRPNPPAFRLGFLPHHAQAKVLRGVTPMKDCLFIDPAWHPLRVIDAIGRCEQILSQSMHGLIFADSYGIPNAWISPHESMIGGEFKFNDYYSTTTTPKRPIAALKPKDYFASKSIEFFVSEYRFDREAYMRELKSVIGNRFPRPPAL